MCIADLENVFDGCAWLEYCGRLYETMGTKDKDGRHEFSDLNDGSCLALKFEVLLSDACDVHYDIERRW